MSKEIVINNNIDECIDKACEIVKNKMKKEIEKEFALWNCKTLDDCIPSANYEIMIENLIKIFEKYLFKRSKE